MKKILIISFCLFISTLTNLFCAENDKDWTLDPKTSTLIPKYLGKIKSISGKAVIGDRELKKGSKVYNNDLIQTMEKSFIVMEMIDLTTITLGPQSDFKVENWSYRTKNDRNAQFTIQKGQWRAFVRSKSQEADQLKIKTPLVSMGIRGTELMVNVLNALGKEVTQVALLEGAVHIEGEKNEPSQDLVPGDHAVIVKSDKGFEHKDRKITPEEKESYQEYMAPGVLRLLEPIKIESTSIEAANGAITDETSQTTSLNHAKSTKKESSTSSKSVKENLQLLNAIREENRKP